jgi:hypothetical protein
MGIPDQQDIFNALVSSMGKVNGALCVKESSASFSNEYFASIGEFHYSSLFPSKKVKAVVLFKFRDLFAERRLADTEYLRGSREAQLIGQNDDGVQVARVNVGEHCSNPKGPVFSHSRSGTNQSDYA